MPTYDFRCKKCGHIFERFQRTVDNKEGILCPKCKSECERLVGAGSGLVFKGSGFYLTDYAKKHSVS